MTSKVYAAIDLHSNNSVLVVQDERDRVLLSRRLPNRASAVLECLEPFREALQCVAVESTYNWYWLVDALLEAGHPAVLVHTAGVQQYSGLKYADDCSDAQWVNRLSRLGVLPTGYIYPRERRPLRDLGRRRGFLVRQRTALLLSLSGAAARWTGSGVTGRALQQMSEGDLARLLPEELELLGGAGSLAVVRELDAQILRLEKALLSRLRPDPSYRCLLSIPGVGPVLGLCIRLEAGEISRFPSVGDFVSYCRLVRSEKRTNGRKKGKGNVRNGNPHLCWAFMEAAQHAMRHHEPARRYFQRKAAGGSPVPARKALAHKLARAGYCVLRDQTAFDSSRLFG